MSVLVVMGSGETAPTMVRVHRSVLADLRTDTGEDLRAVMLDTPFAFQQNVDDLTARTRRYFADSVGVDVAVASWRRAEEPALQRERTLALLAEARWVFAGPGSPTFALRQWRDTPVPGALSDVVTRGGTLVFGSAAACTLGTHAVPVYEIYKAGEDLFWAPGLDLLGDLAAIHAVVIPHYDNAEGGHHDTRFCYLGESRLAELETRLPEDVGVLGVDEHTALILDLAAGSASVTGNGFVTVRRRGRDLRFNAGQSLPIAHLRALLRGEADGARGDAVVTAGAPDRPRRSPSPVSREVPSLRGEASRARAAFDAALRARDAAGCAAAVLELEAAVHDWSQDTLQSDDTNAARRELRAMVVRLGELAEVGARDPREALSPLVELLLRLRESARAAGDFDTSDLLRARLADQGVDVRDTPDGAQWDLR